MALSKEDFYRLIKPTTTFKIKDLDFELCPNVGDMLYFTPITKDMDEKQRKQIMNDKMEILRNIFKRSISKGTFPEVSESDLELFLIQNFEDINNGLMKCYGGLSDEDIKNSKKKIQEDLGLEKDLQ